MSYSKKDGGHSPLILDALHLVIQAEHDPATSLILFIVIIPFILRVIKVRVDGIFVKLIIILIISIKLIRTTSGGTAPLGGGAPRLGSFLQRKHQAASFPLLSFFQELGVEQVVDLDATHLDRVAVRIATHQDTVESVARAIDLRAAKTILLVGRLRLSRLSRLLLHALLHALLHLGGHVLLILLLWVKLLLLLLLLLWCLTGDLRLLSLLVNSVDRSLGLRSIPACNGLGSSLGGHTTTSGVVARVGGVHHGLHSTRFLLDGRLVRHAWFILDGDAIAVGLAARKRQGLSGRLWAQGRLSVVGRWLLGSSRLRIDGSGSVLRGLRRGWCFRLGVPRKLSNVELGQLVLPSLSRHVSYMLPAKDRQS